MYDEVLGKKEFEEALRGRGLDNEQIETEWKRLVVIFEVELAKEYFNLLSEDEKKAIDDKIDGALEGSSRELEQLKLLSERMKNDLNKGLLLDLVRKCSKLAVDLYQETFRG